MRTFFLVGLCVSAIAIATPVHSTRGIAPGLNMSNRSLVVGVSHNLPGIQEDVDHVTKMVRDEAYGFENTTLQDSQGTVSNIAQKLTKLSAEADATGTFLFYFTGHGNKGLIFPQDRTMTIGEIRKALEKGREQAGSPLDRLVLIFDSCYAGSLLDPVRNFFNLGPVADAKESMDLADNAVRELGEANRAGTYWKSLFVFAACRANETSLAGNDGSVFTNAMYTAFEESMKKNATLGEFVKRTQKLTQGHHPVARFAPADVENEKMH